LILLPGAPLSPPWVNQPYTPAVADRPSWRYHLRSNVVSTFSVGKAKFRDHVRARTDTAMTNKALCKLLAHNVRVIHQSYIELGVAPVSWQDENAVPPNILPMVRPG
jgi:hypothetical protein